ncbi:MAG: transglutaminase-like domain-containing protein [Planctomycetota bacterium]
MTNSSQSPRPVDRSIRRRPLILAIVGGLALAAGHAWAQPKPAYTPSTQPAKPAPAVSAAPPAPVTIVVATTKPPTEPGPYLKASTLQGWTVKSTVQLTQSSEVRFENGETTAVKVDFPFETMSVVYPVVPLAANSVSEELKTKVRFYLNNVERITGEVSLGISAPMANGMLRPELLRTQLDGSPYHSGTHLVKMALGEPGRPMVVNWLKFEVEIPMTCWDTHLEDELADKVTWPKNGWPLIAATTFQAQLYVDAGPKFVGGPLEKYDTTIIDNLFKNWFNAEDPKKLPPVRLAKYILSKVLPDFKLEGLQVDVRQQTESGALHVQGLRINGAEQTARKMQGTEWDLVCLTAALFRKAGIPTRTIVGYDMREEEMRLSGANNCQTVPRAWVEIYLYDEVKNVANWIPVDPARMRKASNRTPRLDEKWRWFGTHDEMRGLLPLGYQFHPPTSVRSYGSSALWGWMLTPVSPGTAGQSLLIVPMKSTLVDSSVKGVPAMKYGNDPRPRPRTK